MAEFVEVMKQKARMCKTYNSCGACEFFRHVKVGDCDGFQERHPDKAEKIIMEWAAEHPEPKYPSWNEAWKRLFPNSANSKSKNTENAPCLAYFLSDCPCYADGIRLSCAQCRKQPIPADIAEKLGIKPIVEKCVENVEDSR